LVGRVRTTACRRDQHEREKTERGQSHVGKVARVFVVRL
jgi:hypothetical protein